MIPLRCTHLRGGKAFPAEQKICELKELILRSKRIEKFNGKRIKLNVLIKNPMFNLNNTRSAKYRYLPQQIEEQAHNPDTGKYFQEVYDFHCLIKVKEDLYWLIENVQKIKNRFLRQEPFALKDQFVE